MLFNCYKPVVIAYICTSQTSIQKDVPEMVTYLGTFRCKFHMPVVAHIGFTVTAIIWSALHIFP